MAAQATVQRRRELLRLDEGEAEVVQQELHTSVARLEENLQRTVEDIEAAVAALERRGGEFLDRELAFRPLRRLPSNASLQERFEREVLGHSLIEIRESAEAYLHRLVDHNRAYWRQLQERLRALMDLLVQGDGPDAALYAEQREDLPASESAMQNVRSSTTQGGALVAELQAQFTHNLARFRVGALAGLGGWLSLALAFFGAGTAGRGLRQRRSPCRLPYWVRHWLRWGASMLYGKCAASGRKASANCVKRVRH